MFVISAQVRVQTVNISYIVFPFFTFFIIYRDRSRNVERMRATIFPVLLVDNSWLFTRGACCDR